jgi:protein-L-isoaspartate(D-aspartate) O-methyltransferase
MLELLDLAPGMKVLEIGTGTGYNAALVTEIVGDQGLVVTVDVAEDVVDQTRRLLDRAGYPGIHVLVRDGFDGAPEDAPFDRIVVTVGCSDLSPRWAEQLADGGFMLVPLEHAGAHPLFRVGKGTDVSRVEWSGGRGSCPSAARSGSRTCGRPGSCARTPTNRSTSAIRGRGGQPTGRILVGVLGG